MTISSLPTELEPFRRIREQVVSVIADVPISTLQNWRSLPPEKDHGPPWEKLPSGAIRYKLSDVIAWLEAGRVERSR